MNLGIRLETAIKLLERIENNQTFADIGSDHAFLPIEVLKRGVAKNAIAADVNKMPLEKGKENAEEQGIDMKFILSDGFDNLEDENIDSAAICGMGGELIANMILRSDTAHKCNLVLQPMSAQEELRKALWENGFDIINEEFVTENGKTYVLILTKFDGIKRGFDYIDLYLGKVRPNNDDFLKYKEKIQAAAKKRRLGLIAKNEDTSEIDELIGI